MKDVTVRYDHVTVLESLNWTVRQGENWAVVGPNGAGKSTLLNLITGDNLQAYANEIYLFGKRRGSGESLWEIKERIGVVSAELQVRYRKDLTAFDVVASGLFDSVGLYRRLAAGQSRRVRETMQRLGLSSLAARNYHQLSYGERRMVLIARALVKSPPLLILDEPCQGLDRANRALILAVIDRIGQKGRTSLIYVTHHEKEIPPSVHHILRLNRKGSASVESR
jgi:molybdate transport system ATP-binding protein